MKLTRIEIKNFRSIFAGARQEEFALDIADGMNAIAGPNNCGKSNLFKALRLALDQTAVYDKAADIPAQMANNTVPRVMLEFEINPSIGPERTLLNRVRAFEQSESGRSGQSYADVGKVRFRKTFPAGDAPPRESFIIKGAGARQGDPELLEKALQQFHRCIRFVLIKSGEDLDELLAGNFREILYAVLQEQMGEALERANKLRENYVDGVRAEVLRPLQDEIQRHAHDLFGEIQEVRLDPDVRTIQATLANVGITLTDVIPTSLGDKGTGVRGAVLVAMLRYLADHSRKSLVLAVEEPEAFLHPGAQEELRDDLEGLATRSDVTLLVTTHSPFIPSRDPDAQLVAVEKDEDGRTHIVGRIAGDEPQAATLSGLFRDSVFTDLLSRAERVPDSARGVLFVEGTTDEEYLRIAARKAGRNDLLTGLHIIPTGGASKLVLEVLLVKQSRDLPMVVLLDTDEQGRLAKDRLGQFNIGRDKVLTYSKALDTSAVDIEAEDLIAESVLDAFAEEMGRHAVVSEWRHITELGRYHYGFNAVGKDHLPDHLRRHAAAADLAPFVTLLETIRKQLKLPTDGSFVPLDKASAKAIPDVWKLTEWSDDDVDLQRAVWLLEDLTPSMAQIVASFTRHPGGAKGDVIGAEAGYAGATAVAPALGHIGDRCKQVERRPMWNLGYESASATAGTYTMDPAVNSLFCRALDQVLPGWRSAP